MSIKDIEDSVMNSLSLGDKTLLELDREVNVRTGDILVALHRLNSNGKVSHYLTSELGRMIKFYKLN